MRLRYGDHGSDGSVGIPTAIDGTPFQGFWVLTDHIFTSHSCEVALAMRAVISRMVLVHTLRVPAQVEQCGARIQRLRGLHPFVFCASRSFGPLGLTASPQAAGGFGR